MLCWDLADGRLLKVVVGCSEKRTPGLAVETERRWVGVGLAALLLLFWDEAVDVDELETRATGALLKLRRYKIE